MPSADASQDYLSHYFDIPRYQWLFAGSIGLFVALFLLAFQPFGVNNFDPTFSIRLEFALAVAGFGAVITATVVGLYHNRTDAFVQRIQCSFGLGYHSACDSAVGNHRADLFGCKLCDDFSAGILDAGNIGQQ